MHAYIHTYKLVSRYCKLLRVCPCTYCIHSGMCKPKKMHSQACPHLSCVRVFFLLCDLACMCARSIDKIMHIHNLTHTDLDIQPESK
jgi:hypothetical protein